MERKQFVREKFSERCLLEVSVFKRNCLEVVFLESSLSGNSLLDNSLFDNSLFDNSLLDNVFFDTTVIPP